MSSDSFAARAAKVAGVAPGELRPLAGGDLSEIYLIEGTDGRRRVAKSGSDVATEAAMLAAIRDAGVPVPDVDCVEGDTLLLDHIENDGSAAWVDLGVKLAQLHEFHGEGYGWATNYAFRDVALVNDWQDNWLEFWLENRLLATAKPLANDWHRRVEKLAKPLADILPAKPPSALLHGDLWSGNFLTRHGKLAALIDPACYYGDGEVDLAMLTLFGSPDEAFLGAYGELNPGWEERRTAYQLFPALVHLRLFGSGYANMADGLLQRLGA